jgi:tricorn protease
MASPLAKPGVDAENGDLILDINRHPVASLADVSQLLRNQSDQQVLLTLSRAGKQHQVIVYPVDLWQNRTFAWQDWAEQNQQQVRAQSHHQIGYIYLHAMIDKDVDDFVREFYANIDKQGLIIDVRNNQGGNVDSWILDKLMRRAWMFWKARHGSAYPNMQQAFRGHIAVLANQMTYSDGETFTAGVKALNLGPVIGMRTFGAGVWLDSSNNLTDWGRARVAQYPQYSVDGQWLIEQRGVAPTIEVDNLPYETFMGHDAQLQKAIDYLNDKIRTSPLKPLAPVVKAGTTVQAVDIPSSGL